MQSKVAELEHRVSLVGQQFKLHAWSTADGILRESVDAFLHETASSDHYAWYLAERIYLDKLTNEQMSVGIEQYLKHYVKKEFKGDENRKYQIDRICRDAQTGNSNANSRNLRQLLNTLPVPDQSVACETAQPSCNFKDTAVMVRQGDMVFLPEQANIVVVGDTHGDLASTREIIARIKRDQHIERGGYVVFLGDYVHNGTKSWQNLQEILRWQHSYPDSIVLLSGNHEFKESFLTALNQYFKTHWERFTVDELPDHLKDRLPINGNHYGHMRLQLIREFGFNEGERLYSDFANWGLRLPVACVSGNLMISHSLGRQEGLELSFDDLLHAKQLDDHQLRQLGYETWQTRRPSLHSELVNNRNITAGLLEGYSRVLNVNHFVVGHCHYRSGDTRQLGNNRVTTIVSSAPTSPDAGHYMYQQMFVAREKMRCKETCRKETLCQATYSSARNLNVSGPCIW